MHLEAGREDSEALQKAMLSDTLKVGKGTAL